MKIFTYCHNGHGRQEHRCTLAWISQFAKPWKILSKNPFLTVLCGRKIIKSDLKLSFSDTKIVKKILWTLVKNLPYFLEKNSDQMEAKIKEKLIGIENKNKTPFHKVFVDFNLKWYNFPRFYKLFSLNSKVIYPSTKNTDHILWQLQKVLF